jgi:hypothetical protein
MSVLGLLGEKELTKGGHSLPHYLSGKWYLFNDAVVEEVNTHQIKQEVKQAYLTFWIRYDQLAYLSVGFPWKNPR